MKDIRCIYICINERKNEYTYEHTSVTEDRFHYIHACVLSAPAVYITALLFPLRKFSVASIK